jgi:uncharacterized pyridoxal phosphate-containing UPF0001 family protein
MDLRAGDSIGGNIRFVFEGIRYATKAGFLPDEVDRAMPSLVALPHVAVKGLVAIPLPTNDPEQARSYFGRLRDLARGLSPHPISTSL